MAESSLWEAAQRLQKIGQDAEAKRKAKEAVELPVPAAPAPKPEPQGQLALPFWPEEVRGVPNSVLRSALFGAIRRGRRAYQERVPKASVEGVKILHTGPTLDQADLDVWEQALHLARTGGLGCRIQFTAHSFLKSIGRYTGKHDHEWLKGAFTRLASSVVEIVDGKRAYFGPLLHRGARDDETKRYVIELNPDIVALYGLDGWSRTEWEWRRELKGKPLAQWLHGFYTTHARPYPMKVETLHRLCGSEAKRLADYRKELREALSHLEEVTWWKWEIDENDLVHIDKNSGITHSQAKHLAKKGTG